MGWRGRIFSFGWKRSHPFLGEWKRVLSQHWTCLLRVLWVESIAFQCNDECGRFQIRFKITLSWARIVRVPNQLLWISYWRPNDLHTVYERLRCLRQVCEVCVGVQELQKRWSILHPNLFCVCQGHVVCCFSPWILVLTLVIDELFLLWGESQAWRRLWNSSAVVLSGVKNKAWPRSPSNKRMQIPHCKNRWKNNF